MSEHLNRRLSPMDAFFLYLETEAQPMHIGAVCEFDGKVTYSAFVKHLESRLHLVPRYRQRVVPTPCNVGHPTWENDPDFDIRNHIFKVKLEAPGDDEQLRRLANKIFTGVLDRNKPLWEIYVAEGYQKNKTALIFKVHHCMVDGVAGISLAFVIFDMTPETNKIKKEAFKPDPLPERGKLLYDAIWDTAIEGIESLTRLQRSIMAFSEGLDAGQLVGAVRTFGSTMTRFLLPYYKLPFNRPLKGGRKVTWRQYSFAEARAIRAMTGGTVNDVVLTAIGGAVRKYCLDHKGVRKLPRSIRVLAPVNVRQENERAALGNRISFMPIDVPLHPENPIERLQEVHIKTRDLKEQRIAQSVGIMFEALQGAPAPLQSFLLSTIARQSVQSLASMFTAIPPGNIICTNVPGPQIPLYVLGRRLTSLYPLVPVCLEMGVNFAITSYDQKLCITVCSDSATVKDAEKIADYLDESFAELREVTEVTQANYVRITRSYQELQNAPEVVPTEKAPAAVANGTARNNGSARGKVKKPAARRKTSSRSTKN